MKKFLSSFVAVCIVSSIAVANVSFAATCGVPTCDIEAQILELRNMNGDQRGMFAINLTNQYKNSTDSAVLQNLYDLAVELHALSTELKDEDWVLRAANDLKNAAIINLAKYSVVNGEKLVGFYKEFATATFRYNLIAHWQTELANIEDVKTLNELVIFAEGARDHSYAVADEDWIPRAATTLISAITIKLTSLDPVHEGLYKVALSDASQALGILPFDRVAVLDSSSDKNLVVSFINSKLKTIVFTFNHAEISGSKIKGSGSTANGMNTSFELEVDRTSGDVVGTVFTTVHDRIEFAGSQVFSTRSVFAGAAPKTLVKEDILGTLKGELAGVAGTLKVKSFRDNVYSATFVSSNGSIVINFTGRFYPKNGVLSLTSKEELKLTLSYRVNAAGVEQWQGASFSVKTGTTAKASFSALN